MRENIFVALVHYPVYNKNKEIVATSVTNFDIHDISRSAKTYDLRNYYIITPVDSQIILTNKIIGFWQEGFGKEYNKDRNDAFTRTLVKKSIEETIKDIEDKTNKKVKIITTSAKTFENSISFKDLSNILYTDKESAYLILFGTGWGLTKEIMDMSTYILEPIRPNSEYNHLSVRSAASIIFDRLFGDN